MSGLRMRSRGRFADGPAIVGSLLVALLVLGRGITPGQAQNRPAQKFEPDSSGQADKLLRNAADLARDRQWSEAINIYQRVIDQFGDKVAKLPQRRTARTRRAISSCMSTSAASAMARSPSLPPEAREIYRNRVDGLAERWFRQGASQRDLGLAPPGGRPGVLQLVGRRRARALGRPGVSGRPVRRSPGDVSRLVPIRRRPDVLVHPDPSVDLARVAAKKLLCRAAAGEKPSARRSSTSIARLYPAAAGALAGRKGPYREILAESLAADHLAPPSQPDSRWPTFAGSLTRSKVVPGPIDVGSTQWRVELEKVSVDPSDGLHSPRWRRGHGRGRRLARAAAGLSSDRAGRPGDRLRRHAGAGV